MDHFSENALEKQKTRKLRKISRAEKSSQRSARLTPDFARNTQAGEQTGWVSSKAQTRSGKSELEAQPTMPFALRTQRARTQPRKYRFRWLVALLSVLLVGLIGLGLFLSWPLINQQFFPSSPTITRIQHALNPELQVVSSSGVADIVNPFMEDMLKKNWDGMWHLLAGDAQQLWANELDFTRFEQAKFGGLTLQKYRVGQAVISRPWINPDTTQIYASATLLPISLQATAPPGLLTVPSNQDLARGLFQNTQFALVMNSQGNWRVILAGPADLDAPVLVPARPRISHLLIPIYMYHHISSLPTHNALDYNLTVTATDFNAQLNWMQQQGYHTITMTELFDTFYYGKALPTRPMILTFDDGYADVYTYALPLLLAHHYRGVFYIITGMIGGNYMTWDEVRTLDRSGMQIASHTIHHVNIGHPPANTTTQKELVDSKSKLESELHKPIQFFCYPTGEPFHHDTLAEQQLVLQDLFLDNYLGATLDPDVFDSTLQNSQQPYELPRIRVSGGENLQEFIGILSATINADRLRLQRLHTVRP